MGDPTASADEAALWAGRRSKKPIVGSRPQKVEEAFAAKLAVIPPESDAKAYDVTPVLNAQSLAEKPPQVDKTVLVLPEPRRIRDRDHIRHVIKQPYLICGRRP